MKTSSILKITFSALAIQAVLGYGQVQPVTLTLGTGPIHAISPLIYGANFASQSQAHDLNLPINRNGGNATTRYNWQQDSTSSGSDWYFLSHPNGNGTPSESIDSWITGNKNSGAPGGTQSMISIPILGYVAKTGAGGYSWSFSVAKYGPQQATEPSHSDAGNGLKANGTKVTGNDPNDANMVVPITYQTGWIRHLISTFGYSLKGGVTYYLLDNEPSLWQQSHRDVFPNGVTMGDLFTKERDAATLVKQTDPGALVCGPEEWGWLGYLYSGSDYDWMTAHNWQGTPPDKAAHGNLDAAAYILQQFSAASATAGKRLLDVFSLHYYPQSNFASSDSGQTATLWRNRATRSLWDANYTDESWIAQKINLIPRMKGWINTYYPGTKLGITEYNWGDDNNPGAAIAQADSLGIFGRESVDLATRWVCPIAGTMSFKAFQMYRNVDGANGSFGDQSLPISAPDPDTLSAFASVESSSGSTKIMLVHKRIADSAPITLVLSERKSKVLVKSYQLTASGGINHLADQPLGGTSLKLTLPPQSVTLLVIPR